ncbi:ATP-dependent RNA helicase DeaD [Buchnera aphidicola (Cinara kochiana kochiana)]|uniref:ATP-dependent RNA helicase DeaD n=1 Tax=Buchnera aphidicola (Cinara kochiana kochiana) TaxID=2518976 RepID=A0A451D5V4_9GAMM|nr:DEAD/DEAH box helicase [Buchnera aphidicola]VFP81145.1 ATP-dependent RNA helicase DeaD [Buchnera aphidicola (Cinara kochiana kochiana)]
MTQIHHSFSIFGLNPVLLKSLKKLGYIKPSPIQSICIPYLLSGKDVLGMAQTGSGKTAAFALPLLHNIDISLKSPQILVLVPTRELAIQVAKAFFDFSQYLMGTQVLALYGGQRYEIQLQTLRKGPQIIVGTPGRLLDHLKRGTLNLIHLHSLVLDEADEMLRMGFIEDVENIMSKIPKKHQTALFSATMPNMIRRISQRFMNFPKEVKIQSTGVTRPDIQQSYWIVRGKKTDALIRFLEVEDFSATIIFVRTKSATLEVSETLEKHGYNSAALNGDMNQLLREQTLERLKTGKLDILIATDVAARGLDVDRISFVINYDIPMDAESYVHRIGRTGRAGRAGRALLFVEYRERRLLRNIERIIKHSIQEIELPKSELVAQCRLKVISEKIQNQLDSSDLESYKLLLYKLNLKDSLDFEKLSAALLRLVQGERPLIIPPDKKYSFISFKNNSSFIMANRKKFIVNKIYSNSRFMSDRKKLDNMVLCRIEVGRHDGIEVRHIVGAIANEGDISSRLIGNIRLFTSYSTVELPQNHSNRLLICLSRTRILNKPINIKLITQAGFRENKKKFISRNRQNYKTNNF